jgi:hypothetical protein
VAAGAAVAPRAIPGQAAGKAPRAAASFELPPGSFNLNFTALGADGSVVDRWTQQFAAPDWSNLALGMSTPRFYRAQSLQELRAIQAAADPAPTAARQFSRSDRVLIDVECYTSKPGALPRLEAHIQTREGRELAKLPMPALEQGRARFELPVGSLGQGTYILRLRATLDSDQVEQLTAIVVAR